MDFDLAGPGSRACAILIDTLLMALPILLLILCAIVMEIALFDPFDTSPSGEFKIWAIAIIIAVIFVVNFCYFIVFEMLMGGQTPGKKKMELRTIRDDGTPINISKTIK